MLDQPRMLLLLALLLSTGLALLLAELRWFRRPSLSARLAPFAGHSVRTGTRPPLVTLQDAITPLAVEVGARLTKVLGVKDDLATRISRAHLDVSVSQYRLRQLLWASAALGAATFIVATSRPPLIMSVLFLTGLPLLAFLLLEQRIAGASKARTDRLFAELPVMSEQLAMLLGAGYSLGSAINRLAERGGGVISQDLSVVRDQTRHGVPIIQALREWAQLADVPELHRLVAVLSLGSETSDLGRLISAEAKSIRKESQRRLSETIEKRAQQVWVPVTVATLVPGVIFLTIPFLQALQLFSIS